MLKVEEGQIFGLLGQNGAGKTTMVKILLGLVKPTAGSAWVFDRPAGQAGPRAGIGYLPEGHEFPGYHSAAGVLDFYGGLYGMPRRERRRRIDESLELVELAKWKHAKIRKFSKGMKQRLGIAHAIFHQPRLMFLDEPTDGIDPLGRRSIRDLMLRLKGEGRTIFLNSHLLSEVERVCDRVAILDHGRILKEGTVEELTQTKDLYALRLAGAPAGMLEAMRREFPDARLDGEWLEVELKEPREIDRLVDWLRGRGISIRELRKKRRELEEAFVELLEARSERAP
jgi:ABC-2 type transport system ATP-binding protein